MIIFAAVVARLVDCLWRERSARYNEKEKGADGEVIAKMSIRNLEYCIDATDVSCFATIG